MTSLLSVYDRNGKFVGNCGAPCYDAKHVLDLKANPKKHGPCTCICGGKNHSVGANAAMLNCEKGVGKQPADLEYFAKMHGLEAANLTVIDRLRVSQGSAKTVAKARLNPATLVPSRDDLFGRLLKLDRQGHPNTPLPAGGAAGGK